MWKLDFPGLGTLHYDICISYTYSIFWPVRRCLEEDSKWPGHFGFSSSVDLCQWCYPVVTCYPVMTHLLKMKQRRRRNITPPSIWQPLSLTMSNNLSSLLFSSLLLELQSWVCSDYNIINVFYLEFRTILTRSWTFKRIYQFISCIQLKYA